MDERSRRHVEDETITRSAERMERIIRELGRAPRQRDPIYPDVTAERYRASFAAPLHSRAASRPTVLS